MWRPIAHAVDHLVSWQMRRTLFAKRSHRTDREALARMVRALQPGDAHTIFPLPPEIDDSEVRIASNGKRRHRRHQIFTMPSAHPSEVEENSQIHGRVVLPKGKGWDVPFVILVHPWIGPGTKMMIHLFGRGLLRRGIGVVAPQLPHHFWRKHPETWNGELSICGDLCSVLMAAQQAVADVRRVNQWVRRMGATKVGLMGYSLGGAVVALTVSAAADFDCAVAVVPPSDAQHALQQSSLTEGPIRDDIVASQLGDELLAQACRLISPLIHQPQIPSDRLLVVGAQHDAIIPLEIPEELAAHWKCELWREPQSHITLFQSGRARRNMAKWMIDRLAS